MMSMSLSGDGSSSPHSPGSMGSPTAAYNQSRRKIANKETAAILKARYLERDAVKQKMLDSQAKLRQRKI